MNRNRSAATLAAALAVALMFAMPCRLAAQKEPQVRKEMLLRASLADVWNAWTTTAGCITFFAPGANVELRKDGAYEIYFVPSAPKGKRGSEGCTVLSFEPMKTLAFTWNAPPQFTALRKKRTRVELTFEAVDDEHVNVVLLQTGWGKGADWDRLRGYFERAWDQVMNNLQYRFTKGPVQWQGVKG